MAAPTQASQTSPLDQVPQRVVRKLMYFSAAVVCVPLAVFFTTQAIGLSSLYSGGAAAAAANAVLMAYVFVAFTEDMGDLSPPLREKKLS